MYAKWDVIKRVECNSIYIIIGLLFESVEHNEHCKKNSKIYLQREKLRENIIRECIDCKVTPTERILYIGSVRRPLILFKKMVQKK